MAYFKKLPDVLYPTLKKEKNSSRDYSKIKNLFKRARIRQDFLDFFTSFENYTVVGDDRPDNVAEAVYGDPTLDWVVLVVNDIQNVRNDWPMPQGDFNKFITEKYTAQELSQIHHYETQEVRNSKGDLILPAGLQVGSNFSMKYADNGQVITYSSLFSVTNFEYETRLNEDKRNILILKPEFLRVVQKDIRRIMRYQPSSEYVDAKTIKTYNPRLM